jgi:hypothetical protein
MAPSNRNTSESLPALKQPRARASELISRALQQAQALLEQAEGGLSADAYRVWTQDVERWDARTKMALSSVLAGDLAEEFHMAATGAIVRYVNQGDDLTFRYRCEAVDRAMNTLRSIDERLEFLDEPEQEPDHRPGSSGGRQVFVVHGRDHALRAEVARLLTQLGLDPIVLDEQSDKGRTIIEKFEDHALDVGYAVVLLTADDFGRGRDDRDPDQPNRARQNVILELGYFMGMLGRGYVAALSTDAVERPSDIHGLLYIPLDANWRLRLAKEMKEAGLPVDLNQL